MVKIKYIVLKNGFFVSGTVKDVLEFLRYNSQIYKTVKEMIAVEIN